MNDKIITATEIIERMKSTGRNKTQEELIERIADDAALAKINYEKQEELANEVLVAMRDEGGNEDEIDNG